MAIYTKTGDKGETKVFDKKTGQLKKIKKDSCHIKTIGVIDELNSFLGIVKTGYKDIKILGDQKNVKRIEEIQGNLFVINSILAGSKLRFSKTKTKKLEREIDLWEGSLPVLKNFIYYGGSPEASLLFYARALCRKAERSLVAFAQKEKVPESVKIYLNRLSDYLFMLARSLNFGKKIKENYWIPRKISKSTNDK